MSLLRGSLPRLTVARAARLLQLGLVTSEELCLYCHTLAVVGEGKWDLNAFTHLTDLDSLLEQARASDVRRQQQTASLTSPLDGIPVSIKANIAVSDVPLTAASRILGAGQDDSPPVGYDADVVRTLVRQCGAVLMGVTNMDEFGMGSLGTNVSLKSSANDGAFSVTRNPTPYLRLMKGNHGTPIEDIDDEHLADFIRNASQDDAIVQAHVDALELAKNEQIWSAGGSSCGSAASVAHGSSIISLGSDTGGSIRLPAAWCGVVGLKPSYGLLSRHGLVSYASSFDTIGVLAPSVDCARVVLDTLSQKKESSTAAGYSRDSTASFLVRQPVSEQLRSSVHDHDDTINGTNIDTKSGSNRLSGTKIGIPAAFSVTECPASINDAWIRAAEFLSQHGATIQTLSETAVSPEIVQHSLAAYYVLVSAEASSNLKRYDGVRYGPKTSVNDSLGASNEENDGHHLDDMNQLERQYSATRARHFGVEVARRILCGTSVLSSDRFHSHYEAAAWLRAALTKQLCSALNEVDLLLIPTALSLPYHLDVNNPPDGTEMFGLDAMTVPISLAGLPSISVPISSSPSSLCEQDKTDSSIAPEAGLQLVGNRLSEQNMLHVAKVMEQANMPQR